MLGELLNFAFNMVKIKVVNAGNQPLPAYATSESAGMDLRANIDDPITLHPLERDRKSVV